MTIAILDDDPARIAGMRAALAALGEEPEPATFGNAPGMIAWLGAHVNECRVISLDHDLGPSREIAGEFLDPGTGRDVVDFLAGHAPVCPVIVHTSNSLARPGMELALHEAGWKSVRVYPHFDTDWIGTAWIRAVEEAMSPGARP